jgi:6-phosphofructokinase 1
MKAKSNGKLLAILVGGGPAPGINGVISAATIEALNNGFEVIGILDGFKHLMKWTHEDIRRDKHGFFEKCTRRLTCGEVARIHFDGGSILRTARANPSTDIRHINGVISNLMELGVTHLLTIGGDDTSLSASRISECSKGGLKVVHIPKTIDNDIPLPENVYTFGFQTARAAGTEIVRNLMEDAHTTSRWYLVVTMGRRAGHLALGISKAAGAHLAIIGEEFADKPITLDEACLIIEGAILKRKSEGYDNGVAVIAEGIAEILKVEDLESIPGVEVSLDEYGHLKLAEVPLATILKRKVRKSFEERGQKLNIMDVTLGYELRCAPPIPFDCEYVRDLGYAGMRYLIEDARNLPGKNGALVYTAGGERHAIPFASLVDKSTGIIPPRLVSVKSQTYSVAYQYMSRLKEEDFAPDSVAELAGIGNMKTAEFKKKFGKLSNPITGKTLVK